VCRFRIEGKRPRRPNGPATAGKIVKVTNVACILPTLQKQGRYLTQSLRNCRCSATRMIGNETDGSIRMCRGEGRPKTASSRMRPQQEGRICQLLMSRFLR